MMCMTLFLANESETCAVCRSPGVRLLDEFLALMNDDALHSLSLVYCVFSVRSPQWIIDII